jgi:hypothetical protein
MNTATSTLMSCAAGLPGVVEAHAATSAMGAAMAQTHTVMLTPVFLA